MVAEARLAASDQADPAFWRLGSFSSPQSSKVTWSLLIRLLRMASKAGLGAALPVCAMQSKAAVARTRRVDIVMSFV